MHYLPTPGRITGILGGRGPVPWAERDRFKPWTTYKDGRFGFLGLYTVGATEPLLLSQLGVGR